MYSPDEVIEGVYSGLIEHNPDASTYFLPQLVLNDSNRGRKILEFVLENLEECSFFRCAVAFITRSGVACIHQTLKDYVERGGSGEVLVSKYLNFSDPEAIRTLASFQNIRVRFINDINFHGKTYLFEYDQYAKVLIGSSNLTQEGLGKNTEINLTVALNKTSSLYQEIDLNFGYWVSKSELVNDDNLRMYAESRGTHFDRVEQQGGAQDQPIIPNSMQEAALKRLGLLRSRGQSRSLLISATGTGKTVLAALDVKQNHSKRLLFVVHRLNIARKALVEFRKVFGESVKMGVYSSGDTLDTSADFIFSTIQTINKNAHLEKFRPDHFDYVIIDETHRAGAATYRKIIDYFKPRFLLGMTATPERTDGFDIFSLFNHSIAYEIRLQKALEADLLVPFHYFGISELSVDGRTLSDKSDFNSLVRSQRIDHIISKLLEYGTDSGEPRGLIFCSRVDEARTLSKEFNDRGFKTRSISGADPEEYREESIQLIQSESDDKLDYLFTVDVFNEGVDIPAINQVVLLRPTASSIIFIQQIGRGLRKFTNKEYLTIIDFIGNYENNYLIPLALFGDSSYNKDKLRRLISAGSSLIPGASSISFERIAKDRIFKSIDSAKTNTKKSLTEAYELLRFRLGSSPKMLDFILNETRDPYHYVEYSGSLLAFSKTIDDLPAIADQSLKLLEYLGKHVCDGIRLEEAVLIALLLEQEKVSINSFTDRIHELAGYHPDRTVVMSAYHNLNLKFITERFQKENLRVGDIHNFELVGTTGEHFIRGKSLLKVIQEPLALAYFIDLAQCSIQKFLDNYSANDFINGFKRYSKYTRKDVFRVLNWDKVPNAQNVGGYIVSPEGTQCPIFMTYHKQEGISESTKYEDRFVNPNHLIYMSKNKRTLNSPDVSAMMNQQSSGLQMPFFLKKSNDEGIGFYYLGNLSSLPDRFINTQMNNDSGESVNVVRMEFMLDKPVEPRLYKYLQAAS